MLKDFEVLKAELAVEAAYAQPMFNIFDDLASLPEKVFRRLEKYGLKLSELKAENSAILGERHLNCSLFNYVMTVKIRYDKVEINCSDLPRSHVDAFIAGILDALGAVKDASPEMSFKTFAISHVLHGKIEGQTTMEFLDRMIAKIPEGLGPPTGSGAVFYYGQESDRLMSILVVDMSAIVRDALFIRINEVWDGSRTPVESVPKLAQDFSAQALRAIGLQLKA
ncbi:MAG: hypothetical protein ACREJN_10100 [Nitrospiraceae bacterium]